MTTAIDLIDPSTIPHIDEHDRCFGSLETASGHLPLRALDVRAKISGTVAETTLEQTFVNTFEHPIEATYIFPLPPRAAVSHFELHVAGRVVTGQLKERGAARREYQQAIEQGHRAAIAEQERGDVFNIRVGNLPPGEDARVKLVMTAPLDVLDGEATFRFPLVIAPRYIPGVPLPGPQVGAGISPDTDAVPDASRISPPVLLPNYEGLFSRTGCRSSRGGRGGTTSSTPSFGSVGRTRGMGRGSLDVTRSTTGSGATTGSGSKIGSGCATGSTHVMTSSSSSTGSIPSFTPT